MVTKFKKIVKLIVDLLDFIALTAYMAIWQGFCLLYKLLSVILSALYRLFLLILSILYESFVILYTLLLLVLLVLFLIILLICFIFLCYFTLFVY